MIPQRKSCIGIEIKEKIEILHCPWLSEDSWNRGQRSTWAQLERLHKQQTLLSPKPLLKFLKMTSFLLLYSWQSTNYQTKSKIGVGSLIVGSLRLSRQLRTTATWDICSGGENRTFFFLQSYRLFLKFQRKHSWVSL